MKTGKITKMNAWKNGRGYFVGIDGSDFMYFGKPDVALGDVVEYEVGQPSKNGTPTLKTAHSKEIEAEPIAPSKEAKQYVEEVKAKYQPTDKDATITRLACLKAASELGKTAEETIEIAKKYEKWARA
jgi:hypothetical protein